jgi:hypothetical protein
MVWVTVAGTGVGDSGVPFVNNVQAVRVKTIHEISQNLFIILTPFKKKLGMYHQYHFTYSYRLRQPFFGDLLYDSCHN